MQNYPELISTINQVFAVSATLPIMEMHPHMKSTLNVLLIRYNYSLQCATNLLISQEQVNCCGALSWAFKLVTVMFRTMPFISTSCKLTSNTISLRTQKPGRIARLALYNHAMALGIKHTQLFDRNITSGKSETTELLFGRQREDKSALLKLLIYQLNSTPNMSFLSQI